jgi:hypothetical protein
MLNEDYKEILQLLLKEKVKFLVVGAYALGVHGYPRATGDIDIWVEASSVNSKKVFQVLVKFGSPIKGISEETFSVKDIIFQIGVPPRRIDIITGIDGVAFAAAFKNKKMVAIQDFKIPFLSYTDLISNKKSTGRDKDLLDVKYLQKKKKT